MNFIIDANNLAGKLGILKENNFDKRLIEIVMNWLGTKRKIIVLVFDSLEQMGDRISYGDYLEVIYSPRDGYYKTADDKIVEIFTEWARLGRFRDFDDLPNLNIVKRLLKNDLYFVSDDLELRDEVKNIKYDIKEKIGILSNDEFIAMLNKGMINNSVNEEAGEDDDRGLSEMEIDDINEEMMREWSGLIKN